MKIQHLLLSLSFGSSLLLGTAVTTTTHNQESAEIIQIGKESAAKLAQTLGKNMKAHMKSGGPLDALSFCTSEASTLTQSVNKTLSRDVKAKRVSLRARNVANTPNENEKIILESLQSLQNAGVTLPEYFVQKVGEKEFKFYKPLVIDNGVCLKCHGNLEEGKLKSAIDTSYPEDRARGYKMNELRGAIIVDIKTK